MGMRFLSPLSISLRSLDRSLSLMYRQALAAADTELGNEVEFFWLESGTTVSLIRVEWDHMAGWCETEG